MTAVESQFSLNGAVAIKGLLGRKHIVAQLEALRVKLGQLLHEMEAALASFTPALLAKAFRGEL